MNILRLLFSGNAQIARLEERNKIYEEQIANYEGYIKELERQRIEDEGTIRVLTNENTQFRGSNIFLSSELKKKENELSNSQQTQVRDGIYGIMYNTSQALLSNRVTGYDFQGNPQIEPLVDDVTRVLGQNILENCLKALKGSI